mgnify:CR=1 FL=1
MTEIPIENLEGEPGTGEGAPQTFSERLIERGDGDFVEAAAEPPAPGPPPLERQPVAFQTSEGEVSFAAAPKKRGRPKGKAKPKEPKRPKEPEPVFEPPPPPALVDVTALLEPIFKAYMATNEMRKREARSQRYRDLFQGMVGWQNSSWQK